MDTKAIIDILYNEDVSEEIRDLLEVLCSPDKEKNDDVIFRLHSLILSETHYEWYVFLEFLYKSIPDLLTYFTRLHGGFFSNCQFLENITIPKNIQRIDRGCFYNCKNLKTVKVEEGSELRTIDEFAFDGCKKLEMIDVSAAENFYKYEEFDSVDTKHDILLKLPNTFKQFGPHSLANCWKVEFPAVNSIADLELTIAPKALLGTNGHWRDEYVVIGTKTNSDTLEVYNEKLELGPILEQNKNIIVG